MNQIDLLKKLAAIIADIDAFISWHADSKPDMYRPYMIDLCAVSLVGFSDESFTYDQIKNLAANMINRHDTGASKWIVDVDHCTAERVAIVSELDEEPLMLPINVFLMATLIDRKDA